MSKSSVVVIGCKMPTGLQLELGKVGEAGYQMILVKGANEGQFREGGLFLPATAGGFGRTTVSREFWDAWRKANAAIADEWQAKGLLFVADDPDLALAQAHEKAGVKSGFEPIGSDGKDARTPGGIAKAEAA
jgi:hypothetical protein